MTDDWSRIDCEPGSLAAADANTLHIVAESGTRPHYPPRQEDLEERSDLTTNAISMAGYFQRMGAGIAPPTSADNTGHHW